VAEELNFLRQTVGRGVGVELGGGGEGGADGGLVEVGADGFEVAQVADGVGSEEGFPERVAGG
jgi:hypothetical protein